MHYPTVEKVEQLKPGSHLIHYPRCKHCDSKLEYAWLDLEGGWHPYWCWECDWVKKK